MFFGVNEQKYNSVALLHFSSLKIPTRSFSTGTPRHLNEFFFFFFTRQRAFYFVGHVATIMLSFPDKTVVVLQVVRKKKSLALLYTVLI